MRIGDMVTIKSETELSAWINVGGGFCAAMSEYCDRTAVITDMSKCHLGRCYYLDIDDGMFWWIEEWFTPKAFCEIKE